MITKAERTNLIDLRVRIGTCLDEAKIKMEKYIQVI